MSIVILKSHLRSSLVEGAEEVVLEAQGIEWFPEGLTQVLGAELGFRPGLLKLVSCTSSMGQPVGLQKAGFG